jgi:hypothetical protein
MNPGTVFHLTGRGNHLRIILSPPLEGRVLTCNLTDAEKCPRSLFYCDPSDHEWIAKRSGIPFEWLVTLPCSGFELAIKNGGIRISEMPFPPTKLIIICTAILETTSISESFKKYLR